MQVWELNFQSMIERDGICYGEEDRFCQMWISDFNPRVSRLTSAS